jgi:PAS domain S-box-containing protein
MKEHKISDLPHIDLDHHHASDALAKELLDDLPIPVCLKSTSGDYVYCNKTFNDIIGKPSEEIIGKQVFNVFSQALAEVNHANDMQLLIDEKPKIYECQYSRPDGSIHHALVSKSIFSNKDGNPEGIIGCFTDITDYKQIEESNKLNEARLASLHKISQYEPVDLNDILEFSLEEAIKLTSSKIGYLSHYDEDTEMLRFNSWSKEAMKECEIADKQTVYKLKETGILGEVIRLRRPIILNNFRDHHPMKKGYPEGHCDIDKYLSIPVIIAGRIVAAMGVANKERDYDENDVRQLSLLMDSVWKIVARRKSEAELRETNKKFFDIIDFLPDATLGVDKMGEVIFWNRAMETLTGVKAENILGKGNYEHSLALYGQRKPMLLNLITDPDPLRESQYKNLKRTGDEIFAESWGTLPCGKKVYMRCKACLIRNTDDEIVGAIESLQDITAYQISQEKLISSELRYKTLFNSAGDAILIFDESGWFHEVNQVACEMLGYSREDLLNMGVWDIHAEENMPGINEAIAVLTRTGKAKLETTHKTRGGKLIPVEVNMCEIELAGQRLVLDIARDITERKTAELALRKEEEKYRILFENVSDIVYYHDLDGYYDLSECNAPMNEIIKRYMGDVPSVNLRDVLPRGISENFGEYIQDIISNGSKSGIVKIRDKNGNGYYYEYWNILVRDKNEPAGVRGFAHEITERVRAERALYEKNCSLEEMKARLEESNRDLERAYAELKDANNRIIQNEKMATIGQLAAGVAHEINNPMSFITSNLETFGKYLDRISRYVTVVNEAVSSCAAAVKKDIQKTRNELKIDYILEDLEDLIVESLDGADRVKKTVLDLKSFPRLDGPEIILSDIHEALDSTLNIVWNELKYKAEVIKEYGSLPITKCYPQQLNQVFMNLLVNAAQAIDDRGEIRVRTWEADEVIHVEISDTGSGIPEENLSRIFEPFYTTKDPGKGTGLGLSIACDIVKLHQGEMLVRSEVGKGTAFTVKIPVVGE